MVLVSSRSKKQQLAKGECNDLQVQTCFKRTISLHKFQRIDMMMTWYIYLYIYIYTYICKALCMFTLAAYTLILTIVKLYWYALGYCKLSCPLWLRISVLCRNPFGCKYWCVLYYHSCFRVFIVILRCQSLFELWTSNNWRNYRLSEWLVLASYKCIAINLPEIRFHWILNSESKSCLPEVLSMNMNINVFVNLNVANCFVLRTLNNSRCHAQVVANDFSYQSNSNFE